MTIASIIGRGSITSIILAIITSQFPQHHGSMPPIGTVNIKNKILAFAEIFVGTSSDCRTELNASVLDNLNNSIPGVIVLGTFITEGSDGRRNLDGVLQSEKTVREIVDALVLTTKNFGFGK